MTLAEPQSLPPAHSERDPALDPKIENPILNIEDLSLWYGEKQALKSISMKIATGRKPHVA